MARGRPAEPARGSTSRRCSEAEAHGDPVARATADLHVGLSELDVEAGDLDGARQHLPTAADLVGAAAMNESRFRWFVAMALLAAAEGDLPEALGHLDQAEQLYRPGFFPDVRPIPAIRARMDAQGDLAEAADWARDRGVGLDGRRGYLSEFDHLTLVRLLLAQHRASGPTGRARPRRGRWTCWTGWRDAARATGRAGSLLEIRMLQALAHDAAGRRPQALRRAGRRPDGDPGARGLRPALPGRGRCRDRAAARRRSATGRRPPGAPPARRAARHATAHRGQPRAARHSAPLAEPLSERELQVLRLLDSELTGPEIARELFVSHNTLRTHTKHIFTKLDVTSRRAAVPAPASAACS